MTDQDIGYAMELIIGHGIPLQDVADSYGVDSIRLEQVQSDIFSFRIRYDRRNSKLEIRQSIINNDDNNENQ